MSEDATDRDFDPRVALALAALLGLGGAFFFGRGVGKQRAEEVQSEDVLANLPAALQVLATEAKALQPPLLGGTKVADEAVSSLSARLTELKERAGKELVPIDTSAVEASLARARYEAAILRQDYEAADAELPRVGLLGEEPVLRARLAIARGGPVDEAWLAAWTSAESAEVAEAARLLSAWLVAPTDPDRARSLLREGVRGSLSTIALNRVDFVEAARQLNVTAVKGQIQRAPRLAFDPPLRQRLIAQGVEQLSNVDVPMRRLYAVLEIVGLLRGSPGPQGQHFRRSVLASAHLLASGSGGSGGDPRRRSLVKLLQLALAARLPGGHCEEGGLFADSSLLHDALAPNERALAAWALFRLDQRLLPAHLRALDAEEVLAVAKAHPAGRVLAARVRAAQPGGVAESVAALLPLLDLPPQGAATASGKPAGEALSLSALGPCQRAQALLEVLPGVSESERAELASRATALDPTNPWASLAHWRAHQIPDDALETLSALTRAALRERPQHRALARELFNDLADLLDARERAAEAETARAEGVKLFG